MGLYEKQDSNLVRYWKQELIDLPIWPFYDMAFLPDGRLLVTEREGGVFLFDANLQRIG
eukprot:CAMPEP_0195313372 /NCGR_PEP_ID=MMETSP0708-20121125/1754_1 /TAXON_ID=33640 /ORGANISM="Asterionellopsis glacialis, Strain CCMP134" /LENGTH=58 /DNA_ID=CAMNT_0040378149 /DNA_START=1218 /DNA_END=1390 /DNA_ORIENTATION=-